MKHDQIPDMIGAWMHRLACVVCNPVTVHRRRKFAEAIRDESHAIWANRLGADARRERLRRVIDPLGELPDWQIDFAADNLVVLAEQRRRGARATIMTAVPPQAPFGVNR